MAQSRPARVETETLNHVLSLVEAFRAFDADNDGAITAAELSGIMGSLGYNPSEQEISEMMQRGDTNKDGLLTMEEFLELNTKNLELDSWGDLLKRSFQAFDDDGNEALTGEELFGAISNLQPIGTLSLEDCQAIVASMDVDGDGAVSFEDFKVIVNSLL
ncbi:hypothetical protein I3843_06G024200 [Carya illinoinensis]|nr:hypothetical protein I3760_06G024400 [Carya illinoinensis]KAG6670628.1 hypothetical protein I3843_Q050200 [Carya illinoinensis]KAG6707317.1 hypothetical protein I3842_06G025200 [Carya illinoinensis]KAG7973989.1 hypothetical protein I3843_06G024200 [Carya illinoinensis]